MGYQREFDPEIGEESLRACVNDAALGGATSYALSLSASSASVQVEPGIYRVFLDGMSAAAVVAIETGGSGVTASLPSTSSPTSSSVFAGNTEVRLRVQPDGTTVAALLGTGSGTLYLVPVVML